MKTQTHWVAVRPMKAPAIYKSEHEPFLPGNIAKRGVIGKISRKAISPLTKPTITVSKSGFSLPVFSSKILPLSYRQNPDISPGKIGLLSLFQRTAYGYNREAFLFLNACLCRCT